MMSWRPNRNVKVKYNQIFINNEFCNSLSGKVFPILNPSTAEKICDVQEADKADVEKAIQAAKNAFKLGSPWRTMDASERGRLLYKFADLFDRDTEYLANLNTLENGKTFRDSCNEIVMATRTIRYYAGCADKIHGKTIPADGNSFAFTRREPVGICALIIPWNFPVLLTINKLAPALACGNTILYKPAEQTPLTGMYMASLLKEAGFPPGVVNVLPGYGATVGAALSSHYEIDKVSFTGSTGVGKIIQQAAGKSNTKRVTLEMGGKSPLVIFPDVNLDEAAQIAHDAVFINKGECCFAGTRTYVHEDVYTEFVARCRELAQKRVVGDPFDNKTTQGPQVNRDQLNRILELIESGKTEGAKLECGGSRHGNKGFFMQPTVFSNVTDQMRIAREEIFGPVMQILKFRNLDEVIERCNNTEFGLYAGILTNDLNKALMFSQGVRAGTIAVNCYQAFAPQNPFGGFKMSGQGREFGLDGLAEYSETKTVNIKIPQKNS